MNVEPRRLRGVRETVEATLRWRLPAEEWTTVGAALARLADALARDDPRGVDAARDEIARCDPGRRIVKARREPMTIPDDVRERQNMLVHEIVVRVPDQPRDRGAPDG